MDAARANPRSNIKIMVVALQPSRLRPHCQIAYPAQVPDRIAEALCSRRRTNDQIAIWPDFPVAQQNRFSSGVYEHSSKFRWAGPWMAKHPNMLAKHVPKEPYMTHNFFLCFCLSNDQFFWHIALQISRNLSPLLCWTVWMVSDPKNLIIIFLHLCSKTWNSAEVSKTFYHAGAVNYHDIIGKSSRCSDHYHSSLSWKQRTFNSIHKASLFIEYCTWAKWWIAIARWPLLYSLELLMNLASKPCAG